MSWTVRVSDTSAGAMAHGIVISPLASQQSSWRMSGGARGMRER